MQHLVINVNCFDNACFKCYCLTRLKSVTNIPTATITTCISRTTLSTCYYFLKFVGCDFFRKSIDDVKKPLVSSAWF